MLSPEDVGIGSMCAAWHKLCRHLMVEEWGWQYLDPLASIYCRLTTKDMGIGNKCAALHKICSHLIVKGWRL